MVKYTKIATYYNKNKYMHDFMITKKDFATLEEARAFMDNDDLYYYINNKDISVIETQTIYYSTATAAKRLYKTVELDGTINTNIID